MNKADIPFWEWNDWLFYIKNNFPYRLDDFIRSFSENQVYAKSWLIEHLMLNAICDVKNKEVWVLGSWYGTILVHLLMKKIPNIGTIHLVDYDKEALDIASGMFKEYNVQLHHYDINFDWPKIKGDLIINTSCEHMWPMKDYDFEGLCAFQSNNFKDEQAHINCVDSLEEFIEQTGIKQIDYKGEIQFHKWDEHHKRYMVIGKK